MNVFRRRIRGGALRDDEGEQGQVEGAQAVVEMAPGLVPGEENENAATQLSRVARDHGLEGFEILVRMQGDAREDSHSGASA